MPPNTRKNAATETFSTEAKTTAKLHVNVANQSFILTWSFSLLLMEASSCV